MKHTVRIIAPAMLAMIAAACAHDKGWEIGGEITGAENTKIALEAFNNGAWYPVDSISVDDHGKFVYRSDAPAPYPEVMRLTMDGRSIYFPVDSVDRLTLTTSAADFDTRCDISGTGAAESMRQLDSLINASVAAGDMNVLAPGGELKRTLLQTALNAPTAITGYYLVNKSVGGKPLFDLSSRDDLRFYGAVAQRFQQERPDDPRTAYLSAAYIGAQRKLRPGTVTEISVPETKLFEIVRTDKTGKQVSLSDIASKGGVTILSFTTYGLESSPAYNVILNSILEKYRDRGLNIYQIAFDSNEVAWRRTATNLPWITVWNATTDGTGALTDYNVGALPMTFVIDRDGTLAARVADPEKIEAEVAKHI